MSAIARARALGLADRQLGLVTTAQLERCGVSEGQLRRLVRDGIVTPVHRGVYRTTGAPFGPTARALAACYACGEDAVASHRTAASLRGLIDGYEGPVEVTVPTALRKRRSGIAPYRRPVGADERTTIGIVPVTTVERTLLDLAGCLVRPELDEAVDRAFRGRLTTPQAMDGYLPAPGESRARGVAELRTVVEDRLGRGVPESVLESKMIALLRRYRLPEPVRQLTVQTGGRTVRFDLAYPDRRIAIELDGRAPHWGFDRWRSDHRRNNAIDLGGWRGPSFTWWDVTEDEVYVVVTVASALGLRPSSWRRAN